MTTTAPAMTTQVPPSPASAAILAAAQQRRLLLQRAKDPTLLDEFGPLGAPSPTKSSALAASRRRVVSAAATGTGRPSWEEATGNYPLPSSSKSQQMLQQQQQQQQQQQRHQQSSSSSDYNTNTFPLRPLSNASRNRWEEDWSGNAAAAAMGMTSPASELIRRSSNASQHLLQQAAASSSSSPTTQHQQSRSGQAPTKIPDYAAHRDPQQRRKNLRQSTTVSSPSLRAAASAGGGGSKSSSDSAAASIAPNGPDTHAYFSKSPYLVSSQPPPVHVSTSSSETEYGESQGLRPPAQQSDHLSAARTLHAVNSGGSRSVSAPYVTHDFDEMLPPAVARRIEQQRLMAMDPRLSRIEGLIETWDRDGLPLSAPSDAFERQQRELQQQRLDREQKEKQEAEDEEAQRLKAQQRQHQQAALGVDARTPADGQERAAQMRREQIQIQRQQAQQRRQEQEEQERQQLVERSQQAHYPAVKGYPPMSPNGDIGAGQARLGSQIQARHQEKSHQADNKTQVDSRPMKGGKTKPGKKEKAEDEVDSGCCCVIM